MSAGITEPRGPYATTTLHEPIPVHDLTCEICPVTLVRALLHLEALAPGALVTFILKEGTQYRHVPANLELEGHLLEQVAESNGRYHVTIRKCLMP